MKRLCLFISTFMPILALNFLSSCAVGSATAGYSLKAQSAEGLTDEGEQRIIDRAKEELLAELAQQQQFDSSLSMQEIDDMPPRYEPLVSSTTANYALKAQSAESLSEEKEQSIIDRAKEECMAELLKQQAQESDLMFPPKE